MVLKSCCFSPEAWHIRLNLFYNLENIRNNYGRDTANRLNVLNCFRDISCHTEYAYFCTYTYLVVFMALAKLNVCYIGSIRISIIVIIVILMIGRLCRRRTRTVSTGTSQWSSRASLPSSTPSSGSYMPRRPRTARLDNKDCLHIS
jgi:hypothetical protein